MGVEIFCMSVRPRLGRLPTDILRIVLLKIPISGIQIQKSLQIIWIKS